MAHGSCEEEWQEMLEATEACVLASERAGRWTVEDSLESRGPDRLPPDGVDAFRERDDAKRRYDDALDAYLDCIGK